MVLINGLVNLIINVLRKVSRLKLEVIYCSVHVTRVHVLNCYVGGVFL